MTNTPKLASCGFSLLEMSVVMMISTTVMMGFLATNDLITKNLQKQSKLAEVMLEKSLLTMKSQTLSSTPCYAATGGKSLLRLVDPTGTPGLIAESKPIPIAVYSNTSQTGEPALRSEWINGGVTYKTTLQLKSPTSSEGKIEITATAKGVNKKWTVIENVNLGLDSTKQNITSCTLTTASEDNVVKKVCQATEGFDYDPATSKCVATAAALAKTACTQTSGATWNESLQQCILNTPQSLCENTVGAAWWPDPSPGRCEIRAQLTGQDICTASGGLYNAVGVPPCTKDLDLAQVCIASGGIMVTTTRCSEQGKIDAAVQSACEIYGGKFVNGGCIPPSQVHASCTAAGGTYSPGPPEQCTPSSQVAAAMIAACEALEGYSLDPVSLKCRIPPSLKCTANGISPGLWACYHFYHMQNLGSNLINYEGSDLIRFFGSMTGFTQIDWWQLYDHEMNQGWKNDLGEYLINDPLDVVTRKFTTNKRFALKGALNLSSLNKKVSVGLFYTPLYGPAKIDFAISDCSSLGMRVPDNKETLAVLSKVLSAGYNEFCGFIGNNSIWTSTGGNPRLIRNCRPDDQAWSQWVDQVAYYFCVTENE